jgi:hypothetical protein
MLLGLLPLGCGPDKRVCSGTAANFVVTLKLRDRPLPADTVVHVDYGGSGMEEYSLATPHAIHEVLFCSPADATGTPLDASLAAAGATGDEPAVVEELYCRLWTGGFTTLSVRATGLTTLGYELTPSEHQCTVTKTIVLDSPDGG